MLQCRLGNCAGSANGRPQALGCTGPQKAWMHGDSGTVHVLRCSPLLAAQADGGVGSEDLLEVACKEGRSRGGPALCGAGDGLDGLHLALGGASPRQEAGPCIACGAAKGSNRRCLRKLPCAPLMNSCTHLVWGARAPAISAPKSCTMSCREQSLSPRSRLLASASRRRLGVLGGSSPRPSSLSLLSQLPSLSSSHPSLQSVSSLLSAAAGATPLRLWLLVLPERASTPVAAAAEKSRGGDHPAAHSTPAPRGMGTGGQNV